MENKPQGQTRFEDQALNIFKSASKKRGLAMVSPVLWERLMAEQGLPPMHNVVEIHHTIEDGVDLYAYTVKIPIEAKETRPVSLTTLERDMTHDPHADNKPIS